MSVSSHTSYPYMHLSGETTEKKETRSFFNFNPGSDFNLSDEAETNEIVCKHDRRFVPIDEIADPETGEDAIIRAIEENADEEQGAAEKPTSQKFVVIGLQGKHMEVACFSQEGGIVLFEKIPESQIPRKLLGWENIPKVASFRKYPAYRRRF